MKSKTIAVAGEPFTLFGHVGDVYFDGFEGHAQQNDFLEIVLRSYVEPESMCLDIGANSGLTAFLMDRLIPRTSILCIEPGPIVFRCLAETLKANGLFDVDAINICVGASPSTVRFVELPGFSAGSYVSPGVSGETPIMDSSMGISVEMSTVDEIVVQRKLKRVDFIKIDVEGFEEEVIRGATETLDRFSPIVYLEFNSYVLVAIHERSPKEFLKFIRKTFPGVYTHSLKGIKRLKTDEDWRVHLYENMTKGCVSDLLCVSIEDGSLRPNHKSLADQVTTLTGANNSLLVQNRELVKRADQIQAWAEATDKRNRELVDLVATTQAWADATEKRMQAVLADRSALQFGGKGGSESSTND